MPYVLWCLNAEGIESVDKAARLDVRYTFPIYNVAPMPSANQYTYGECAV